MRGCWWELSPSPCWPLGCRQNPLSCLPLVLPGVWSPLVLLGVWSPHVPLGAWIPHVHLGVWSPCRPSGRFDDHFLVTRLCLDGRPSDDLLAMCPGFFVPDSL